MTRDRWNLYESDSIEPKKRCLNCFQRFGKVEGPFDYNGHNLCKGCFDNEVAHVLRIAAKELAQVFSGGTRL